MSNDCATRTAEKKGAEQARKAPHVSARQPSPAGPYGHVLSLQRSAGNRAVSDLLRVGAGARASGGAVLQRKCADCQQSGGQCADCGKERKPRLQAKLAVSEPGDGFEREADRVAEQALSMPEPRATRRAIQPTPLVQRQATGEAEGGAADGAHPAVRQTLSSAGQPLDPASRDFFEARFGYDFGRVRVHTDARAAESAQAVEALAYTVGRDVVFGAGQYAPATREGRRLLAHELTHVVQQGAHAPLGGAVIQREKKPKAPAGDAAAKKKTCPSPAPAAAQQLKMQPSKNGEPCACLVVIHNNERNAFETAKLMHEHCSYNLVLLDPNDECRRVTLPHHTADVDPNELFPEAIARQCTDDEQSCRDFVKEKAGTKKQAEVRKRVQMQFFLTISDCSNSFTLPVVALHNNDVSETKQYRDKVGGGADVKDLKLDVDKGAEETGADQLAKIKKLLEKMVGQGQVDEMTKSGKTNIFRWCVSGDLSKCHIGDPEHPDNVTWVTNEQDFETLRKENVNVALQSPTVKKGESDKDLSTLFLVLKTVFSEQSVKVIEGLEKDITADQDALDKLFRDMEELKKFGDATLSDEWRAIFKALLLLLLIVIKKLILLAAEAGATMRTGMLRYINIETPGEALKSQSDAERIRNYEAVVAVLSAVGLHCCPDTAKAEGAVKEGLKFDEKAKAAAKAKADKRKAEKKK